MSYITIILITIAIHLSYSAWRQLHSNPLLLDYMRCDPNAWRWWDQLLLRFHKRPLSFQTLESLSWGGVLSVLFIMLDLSSFDMVIFFASVLVMSVSGYVRQAPMYPLLLLVANVHPAFLIPLTLVKEVGGWVGVGILLYQGRIVEAVIYGGISLVVYVVLRIKSNKERVRLANAAPLFTPPYLWTAIRRDPATILRNLMVTIPLILLYFWYAPILFVWVAIPIILFALPWESHLWFPLLIIILGVL